MPPIRKDNVCPRTAPRAPYPRRTSRGDATVFIVE